jgi:hypothetical protein
MRRFFLEFLLGQFGLCVIVYFTLNIQGCYILGTMIMDVVGSSETSVASASYRALHPKMQQSGWFGFSTI